MQAPLIKPIKISKIIILRGTYAPRRNFPDLLLKRLFMVSSVIIVSAALSGVKALKYLPFHEIMFSTKSLDFLI